MDNNHTRYALVLVALVVMVAGMLLMPGRKRFYTSQGVVWTTEYHITYEARHDLDDSIQLIFNTVDMSVSPFNGASLISAFNQGAGCRADSLLKRLYQASVTVWRESNGAFDPTVMPLVNAWGFGYKSGSMPTRLQLDSILGFVGFYKVALRGDSLVKQDIRTQLDFSSIAKGLACDEIGRLFARHGVSNWLVEIGGEVAACGVNKRGTAWQVSVDMPLDGDSANAHSSAMVLQVDSGGVATSGNYRRYYEQGGKRVSHIINPHTGESQPGSLLSVTVTATDCMTADAWATACMVLGEQATQSLMSSRDDLGVMTIAADSTGNMVVWSNRRFANQVVTPQQGQ